MITATSADHDKAFEIIRDIQLIDLNHHDAQFVRAELADAIAAAIAAAVQAEREQADEAEAFVNFIALRYASDPHTREYIEARDTQNKIASIRERNGMQ